jgi:hypothetical protein
LPQSPARVVKECVAWHGRSFLSVSPFGIVLVVTLVQICGHINDARQIAVS